jgi:hypothetical protein
MLSQTNGNVGSMCIGLGSGRELHQIMPKEV